MKYWNDSEFNIGITLLLEGKSYSEVAVALSRTYRSVRMYYNRRGYYMITPSKFIICLNCGKEARKNEVVDFKIKRHSKFCSQSCSASFNNKLKKRKFLEQIKCINCDNFCKKNSKKYCCQNCQFEYQNKILLQKIKNHDIIGLSIAVIRKGLIKLHGEKCMKCGWNERHSVTKKVPLELNHIDGNSENNNIPNLEIICPNCHSLTPNFRALNIGNGRKKRKLKIREQNKKAEVA